jgi:hypothetical protein
VVLQKKNQNQESVDKKKKVQKQNQCNKVHSTFNVSVLQCSIDVNILSKHTNSEEQ